MTTSLPPRAFERSTENGYTLALGSASEVALVGGKALALGCMLRAGIPVSIEIPLRKRTALAYAFEPLTKAFRKSFNEH